MKNKDEINRTIGIRLAALCGSFNVKPDDLGNAIGVSRSQANRILAGKATLSAAQLVLAAQRLSVTTAVITDEQKYGEVRQ